MLACLFLATPLLILIPLSDIGVFGTIWKTVGYYLIGILLGIIMLKLILRIFSALKDSYQDSKKNKKKKKKHDEGGERLNLGILTYYNLNNYGYMINSTGFIIGYALLIYVYYQRPADTTLTENGLVLGLFIVLPALFIMLNLALRTKGVEIKEEDDDSGEAMKDL